MEMAEMEPRVAGAENYSFGLSRFYPAIFAFGHSGG